MQRETRSSLVPSVVLGAGLGGFFDGIVLHQLLQWHHLVSNRESPSTLAGLEANTRWDGIFHAAMWSMVAIGVALVVKQRREPTSYDTRLLLAGVLLGWGGFNVSDSILNHWLLQLHHIREGVPGELAYDVGFFTVGLGLLGMGWLLASGDRRVRAA